VKYRRWPKATVGDGKRPAAISHRIFRTEIPTRLAASAMLNSPSTFRLSSAVMFIRSSD
jgi:hypothetical protein